MKITAGLGAPEAYERLAAAGADELFAGYVPLSWLEKYGSTLPLNRREVLMHNIQFDTPGEMKLLARRVESTGVPVSITFNSICYHPMQYPEIAEMLRMLHDLGFRDWIIADPALLLYLRDHDLPGRIHLSGEAGCFNPDALRFFRRLGFDRLIFPRKITPGEMAACIAAAPGLEYEAFALNERCHYSGAFCSSLHCDELDHICRVPYLPFGPDIADCETDGGYDGFGADGCALCALPALEAAGVTHLKLVGRGADPARLEADVRMLRAALDSPSPADFCSRFMNERCSGSCYYP